MKRVAILISGRGSNMGALIKSAQAQDFPAEIVLVLSNKADAAGLDEAKQAGIVTKVVESKPFKGDRDAFDRAVQAELSASNIDLVCLAGFMRVLTPWFVEQWQNRMINVHPSLLPCFPGLNTHQRALDAGVKIHGATVHFVVSDVDAGPIIMQGAVAVRDDDTAQTLAERVLAVEHRIYSESLRLVASDGAILRGRICHAQHAEGSPDDVLISPILI